MSDTPSRHVGRTGVWLVGARGSVATTAVVGAAAVSGGFVPPTGMVSQLPEFAHSGLPALDDLVFGGHDVTDTPLSKRAEQLAEAGVFPAALLPLVVDALRAADADIRTGTTGEPGGPTQAETAASLIDDLTSFRQRHRLDQVVVVDVSSTEPLPVLRPAHQQLDTLEEALASGDATLPPSSLYAYAALRARCGYVGFTPSPGVRLPALRELAEAQGLPYAGSDAKTGETLIRTALAPVFAHRALRVRSWSGTNLLGGGDGATLADPAAAASKNASKRSGLDALLGEQVEGLTHIDNVPSMGERKTAWDHVDFQGFLGAPMTLQFTWQGWDSALAAPLVLDLVRFLARARQAGATGPQRQLGFFFKDPIADHIAPDHRLVIQFEELRAWYAGAVR
ncbi:myo-inositol-1-phosphate synthase [Streptomyces tanashiensis]|uniref:inositol-3-phosphate synthase n=1 Tax=Streptomyces tanashiensis TaxID=67367 RepID=UPI0016772AD3|nr:inositol-3-phosphate synthase [Streptomyces tanashiensis]GGT14496.1 myo-inositol-1-phosphate synthase [Streptomyces tanashiensis]